ncbi:hypothetical protein J4448_05160 [Candidatus Woesearchaeota archaeon]|nr:hypothetical protein [Candidatus Woesearchaeota archaeon]
MVLGWVPKSLLTPIEQKALINHGFYPDQIGGQSGYFIDASLGTIPYCRAQGLKQNALDQIRQHPEQRYLAVFSHKD